MVERITHETKFRVLFKSTYNYFFIHFHIYEDIYIIDSMLKYNHVY